MSARPALLAIALVLCLPAPAGANGGGSRDPDEQPFCESGDCPDTDYMDFRRASFGHADGRRLQHGIATRERWKTKELGGRHGVTIYFDFSTDDDARIERLLRVRRWNGELRGRMFRGKYHRKRVPGAIRVWRPDRRSVKVRFPARLLGDGVEQYGWRVHWSNRRVACAGSCHTDFAPNRGWYEHRL